MLVCRVKKVVKLMVVAALTGIIVVAIWVYCFSSSLCLPMEGAQASRTYFVNSPTAFACEKQTLAVWNLPFVEGEKTIYAFADEAEAKEGVRTILSYYCAENIWTEEVGETCSYYATSKKLSRQVHVSGRAINLHIAVRGAQVVVGTPVIFGCY